MPIAIPAIMPSASGVSCTRSLPNCSWSPAVARNTPPLSPTSWPNTTTLGSCDISHACARLMASIMVTFAMLVARAGLVARRGVVARGAHGPVTPGRGVVTPGIAARQLALLQQALRWVREQVIKHLVGRGLGRAQILIHRGFYFTSTLGLECFLARIVPDTQLLEVGAQAL